MMWYKGELELARAAKAAGIPFSLATGSITSMEEIAGEVGGTLWMQLYMWADRKLSHQLVRRASAAGFEALLVTVDGAVAGNREYNKRNGFSVPFKYNRKNTLDVLTHPRWMFGVLARYMITTGMPRYENYPSAIKSKITGLPMGRASLRTDSLSWDDLRQLRQIWPRKLIVKGILHPQDAVLAADCGADAVVVSNHGGRNLDVTMAPIEVLPDILQALGGRIPVIVDSGFRRGSDVVKALALGADMVYVGRSTLYGVGAGGEAGATRAINIFREEIDRVMALIGCPDIAGLNSDYLVLPKNVKATMAA
jgi:L-lactate dehydrogenase (cytochrome)/(S)-mandelate dehydrogenase